MDRIKGSVETALDFFHDGYSMRNALMKASRITGVSMSEIAKNLPHKKKEKKIKNSHNVPREDWRAKWEKDHEN